MKTDELILLLSNVQQPIDARLLNRLVWVAAVVSLLSVAMLVVVTLGPRADLSAAIALGFVQAKALLGASVALVALLAFERSLRPGRATGGRLALMALPFVALAIWAGVDLAQAPAAQWASIALGRWWLSCLLALLVYALAPFVAMIAVARQGAPVRPRLTGACAGLGSAGLATIAYSLHCPEDSAPFIASWYSLAMACTAALGAMTFPRLARW